MSRVRPAEPGSALPRRDAELVPGGAQLCRQPLYPQTPRPAPLALPGSPARRLRHKPNQPEPGVENPGTDGKGLAEKPTSGAARRAGRGGRGCAAVPGDRAQNSGWLQHTASPPETPLDGASSPRTARGHPAPLPTVTRVPAARGSAWGWVCPGPLRALLPHQHPKALVHTGSRKQGRRPPCNPLQQRERVLQGAAASLVPGPTGQQGWGSSSPSPAAASSPCALCPAPAPNHLARDERMLDWPSSISLSFALLSCY